MGIEIKMPALSPTMEEGRLVEWKKNVGDAVAVGDELVEIEAAKSSGAVESPADGTLVEILVQVDEEVPVGDVLCVIETA